MADLVMFTYRDEYYNAETNDKNIMECIIGKQRNGETGIIKTAWIPRIQKVSDIY
jgi:replicative DNA helicase